MTGASAMKLPRLTIRRLMLVVAIAGLVLGVLVERRARFLRIAARHKIPASDPAFNYRGFYIPRRLIYHGMMESKYERAARYPWLPVAPDPPEAER